MRKSVFVFGFIFIWLYSCLEVEQVSSIPEIDFQSFSYASVYDTSTEQYIVQGTLEFSFIDGDADLGVYDSVNSNTDYPDSVRYGIFINLFEKLSDGSYIEKFLVQEVADTPYLDTVDFNYLLPYDEDMDREGQNKTINGIIRVSIPFPEMDEQPFDSGRFEFYIRDRALNKSNVECSNDFAWPPDSLFDL